MVKYRYIATDSDGEMWAYENKPTCELVDDQTLWSAKGKSKLIGTMKLYKPLDSEQVSNSLVFIEEPWKM